MKKLNDQTSLGNSANVAAMFAFFALSVIPLIPSIYILYSSPFIYASDDVMWLYKSLLLSGLGFLLTRSLIPSVAELNKRAGLSGKDFGKERYR